MPLQWLFWMLYIISILFGFWGFYDPATAGWYRRGSGYLMLWVLVGLLGYHVFGSMIK